MKTLHDAQKERYAGLLRAARRVVSANQESQPSEYHAAMNELEKIVSPLDTAAGSDQGRGQMELNPDSAIKVNTLISETVQCHGCGTFRSKEWIQVCVSMFRIELCDACARKLASKLNTECK